MVISGVLDDWMETAFSHEKDAEHRASKPYPAWFRGKAPICKQTKIRKILLHPQLVGPKKPGYEDKRQVKRK